MQKVKEIFKDKIKLVHILVIILGIIFISLSNFHRTIWFDESYSVAISAHSFGDIWSIGGNDVHPVLYYWILHILRYIFGNEMLVYRLFSVLAISILGILGYTHIRKDFGEKVGIIFSILVFFMPITLIYSGEIRMYALAMLLTTLTAIYAYGIYINRDDKNTKNWILFGIFSLASAYTHYYSLVASGVINVILFIYLLIKAVKEIYNKLKEIYSVCCNTNNIVYTLACIFIITNKASISRILDRNEFSRNVVRNVFIPICRKFR